MLCRRKNLFYIFLERKLFEKLKMELKMEQKMEYDQQKLDATNRLIDIIADKKKESTVQCNIYTYCSLFE